ncbi:MAG: gamma-glutamyl-gamma-aminobutyrate hydrolase family protein [Alphaproteobacteria bacterium]|nr:gamma-glutamyl-gamma-aminobutyrate hydrolase family protein [Alphaproteobacteria bacterium]
MDKRENIPVIGISAKRYENDSLAALYTQLVSAGAEVRVFDGHDYDTAQKHDGYLQECMESVDAVYILGNPLDIDPATYGQKKHDKTNIENDKARTEFETGMIEHALANKMPLMGVCAGMQRLNTLNHAADGGTLHQHVPDITLEHDQTKMEYNNSPTGRPPFVAVHAVHIKPESVLADIAGAGNDSLFVPSGNQPNPHLLKENSFHHQAVDQIRAGFVESAVSEDGIIEAIEPDKHGKYKDQFVLGVQWHPEFGASPIGAKIANRVVKEAREYAKNNTRALQVETENEVNPPTGKVCDVRQVGGSVANVAI